MPALIAPTNLLNCPFCGHQPEQKWNRPNPSAGCKTEGCLGSRLPRVLLDVPEQIDAWNTRAVPAVVQQPAVLK